MTSARVAQLHAIAKTYVEDGLGKGNFDAIPYHEEVSLRAPINPGGSATPMVGKETLRTGWWAPLPDLVASVTFLDAYTNAQGSAVCAEFYCDLAQPQIRLRIMDKFEIDEHGLITAQENFFDPRDLTHPGWQSS